LDRGILIVDDDESMLHTLGAELESRRYQVAAEACPETALKRVAEGDFGVVLTDFSMRGRTGADLCQEVQALRGEVPVIVMTAFASVESAVGSLRAGACDFLTKPFTIDDLVTRIDRALKRRDVREEVRRLGRPTETSSAVDDVLIGDSPAMARMRDMVARVADTDATVLVSGESGTGKELVSRMIHARSRRARGPFVAICCAAMPEALLESELFGHTKGAFTDARTARAGLFAKASGGTLMLDEVGEMPLGMQAKLLRALQERTVRPVGGDTEVPFDVRIVAATNRDLQAEVRQGRFREDLFYRINVVEVQVPPLRARGNDVLLLAQAFLARCRATRGVRVAGIQAAAAERIAAFVAGKRPRAAELHRARGRAHAVRSHRSRGSAGARGAVRGAAQVRRHGVGRFIRDAADGGGGAPPRRTGAQRARRQQGIGRAHARDGPADALPEAGALGAPRRTPGTRRPRPPSPRSAGQRALDPRLIRPAGRAARYSGARP
jgi:two-component system response regulator HydG